MAATVAAAGKGWGSLGGIRRITVRHTQGSATQAKNKHAHTQRHAKSLPTCLATSSIEFRTSSGGCDSRAARAAAAPALLLSAPRAALLVVGTVALPLLPNPSPRLLPIAAASGLEAVAFGNSLSSSCV